jgi:hypothetical protein
MALAIRLHFFAGDAPTLARLETEWLVNAYLPKCVLEALVVASAMPVFAEPRQPVNATVA